LCSNQRHDERRGYRATHVAREDSSQPHAHDLGSAVHFRVAALTNLSQDHLDFHGSMSAYARAKERLFTSLGPAWSVLNVDDAFGRELADRLHGPVVRVSSRPNDKSAADVRVSDVRMSAEGIRATVSTPQGDIPLASRLVGAHNLDNLLLSLGIVLALELSLAPAVEALSREGGAPGRLERCDEPGDDVSAFVDYAHTPDALARVLEAVRAFAPARVWCVFGCGGDRDPTKRAAMGEAVARRADVVVVTSDNPRSEDPMAIAEVAARGARSAGASPILELDRRSAIALAVASAAPGDVVLIAGKGHEDYQVVGNVKYPFDDRVEARSALRARRQRRGSVPG
jgi:UDP-N-acetylmuramoyl-L-alanyl-D-glutamate--2,6-diaminopimelate ligase